MARSSLIAALRQAVRLRHYRRLRAQTSRLRVISSPICWVAISPIIWVSSSRGARPLDSGAWADPMRWPP